MSKLLQKERIKREEKRYKKKLREAQTSADKTDAGRYTRQAEETLIKMKKGLFSHSSAELQLSAVEGVDWEQGLIDRLVGSGRLIVSGTGNEDM